MTGGRKRARRSLDESSASASDEGDFGSVLAHLIEQLRPAALVAADDADDPDGDLGSALENDESFHQVASVVCATAVDEFRALQADLDAQNRCRYILSKYAAEFGIDQGEGRALLEALRISGHEHAEDVVSGRFDLGGVTTSALVRPDDTRVAGVLNFEAWFTPGNVNEESSVVCWQPMTDGGASSSGEAMEEEEEAEAEADDDVATLITVDRWVEGDAEQIRVVLADAAVWTVAGLPRAAAPFVYAFCRSSCGQCAVHPSNASPGLGFIECSPLAAICQAIAAQVPVSSK